jgi:hypothetical protein
MAQAFLAPEVGRTCAWTSSRTKHSLSSPKLNNKFAVKFKGEVRLNFFFQSCVVFAIPAILVSEVSDQDRLAIKSESTDLASS